MKRSQLRQWLTERLIRQRRITVLAVVVMGAIGAAALLFEYWLIRVIVNYGFFSSWTLSFLIALAIVGGVLAWLWIQTPKRIGGREHQVLVDDEEITFRVAPAMAPVWTYALGSLETDKSFAERILGTLAMPQRMVCTAWLVWQRHQQLQLLDVESCAKVLRLLLRKAERVSIAEISEECRLDNLPRTLHELSLIDGIVFLTRHEIGLSVANRMIEDVNSWMAKRQGGEPEDEFGD